MFKNKKIEALLSNLQNQESITNVFNQYKNNDLLVNLGHYLTLLLEYPYSGHLLVGEAPGFKGCARCGIPFTSQRVINERDHLFIKSLRNVVIINGNQTEITSTKMWNQLDNKLTVPAFWNIFPFHPYQPDDKSKNREPSQSESLIGLEYLDAVVNILQPHTVVAVGGFSKSLISHRYSKVEFKSISHPSMAGYAGFVSGIAELKLI